MSWENITGEQKIVPSGMGGNANEVILKSGEAKVVRLIDPNPPYSYLEHCLEVEKFENGQVTKVFRTIRCPKTSSNPNAHCPLCDGQQVRRRPRHATNVWDFDENGVRKLNQGDDVYKPIATTRKLGVDIMGVNWAILKTGEGRNDTEYSNTNLGASDFILPADAQLYDIQSEYAPHTVDEMQAIVESAGGDWNNLIVPPELQYPTLAEALEHEMPNGKYKGKKFKDIWEADKSNRGMINFLATKSDRVTKEKACAQIILSQLGGAIIPGVPNASGQIAQQVQQQAQPVQQAQSVQQQAQPIQQQAQPVQQAQSVQQQAQPVVNGRQDKINEINTLLATKEKFVKGGLQVIIDTMSKCSGGKTNIVSLTDVELDLLLAECKQA